ncbi:hypothetical protein XENORESO_006641 [Xenotaenia resolanae]|uniref:Uncharacterized protein n=1 Tax=Xenotaenia resolanae TaxID=208358 RepID=A0ABV0WT50_9TELE
MPSLSPQRIFLVLVHHIKPGFPGPTHKLQIDSLTILFKACKTSQRATCSWLSVVVISGLSICRDSAVSDIKFCIEKRKPSSKLITHFMVSFTLLPLGSRMTLN